MDAESLLTRLAAESWGMTDSRSRPVNELATRNVISYLGYVFSAVIVGRRPDVCLHSLFLELTRRVIVDLRTWSLYWCSLISRVRNRFHFVRIWLRSWPQGRAPKTKVGNIDWFYPFLINTSRRRSTIIRPFRRSFPSNCYLFSRFDGTETYRYWRLIYWICKFWKAFEGFAHRRRVPE